MRTGRARVRRPVRWRLIAAGSVISIAASLAWQAPVSAAATPTPPDHHLPAAQMPAVVPATPVSPGARVPAPANVARPAPAPTWPAAGEADVRLAGGAGPVAAAGLPVQVASAAAGSVHVRVLDHATAQRAGVSGFLFQVDRTDGGGQAAPATVRLDYSGFAHAFGGGFASRLTVVALPACAATTPQVPACQRAAPLPTTNDPSSQTLTAQVQTQPAVASTAVPDAAVAGAATAAPAGPVLALTTNTSGGTSDYKATPLASASTWQVGPQTGDFTWTYPLTAPPALGGKAPALALAYDSGTTDGETAQTNSQTSQVGEGFQLAGGGFIERKYRSCADEISTAASKTGDLCWGGDNAYLAMSGHSTELVKDDQSGTWRMKADDGSRVELLNGASNGANGGEYWKVTTIDGTQYIFGLNHLPGYISGNSSADTTTNSAWTVPVVGLNAGEPCHGASYSASACDMAWRWNLDLVVDPNGNATEYFYTPEFNDYLFDSTGATPGTARQYVRGGELSSVGYGSQASNVYAHIPMRVKLDYGDRCLPSSPCSTHTAQYWPDTPWDLSCSGSGCGSTGHEAPSFWTQDMLTGVTTQVYEGSAGYVPVDSWGLGHEFLSAETDDLWLSTVTHTGMDGGTAPLPAVTLTPDASLPNRVAGDGYAPMYKYRMAAVDTESGEQIAVTYEPANCGSSRPAPSTDTLPCFEQWWTPGDPQADDPSVDSWFYKYPVASVTIHDNTKASLDDQVTRYFYDDGGTAWHYDNDDGLVPTKYKSYSQWRGYGKVRVVTGSSTETQSQTTYTYLRGMDGDTLPGGGTRSVSVTDSQGTSIPDSEALDGFQREQITSDGPGGAEVSATIDDPWLSSATATSVKSWATLTARVQGVAAVHNRTDLASGGVRRTEVDNTFNSQGLITKTSDLGDLSTSSDRRCTVNTYVQNSTAGLLNYIGEQVVTAAACGSSGALVSDTRHLYDGGAFGAAPTHGDITETDEWSASDPGVADHWVATSRDAYDSYGRVTSTTDAASNKSSTTYTSGFGPGNATTQTVATDPLGFQVTRDLDAGRGVPLDTIDANGERTDLAYDPLGRLTSVWLPGQSRSANVPANLTFAYHVTGTSPVAVTTNRLIDPRGTYVTSVALYDGQLRQRQTQRVAEAVSGAMLVTDTLYDSRGEVVTENSPYAVMGTPSGTLYGVSQSQVPSSTVSTYDGAGRKTASATYSQGGFLWQTTYTYGGDRTTVVPPQGGTVTTTVTDARNRTVELDQYHGSTAAGPFDPTTYTYTPAGQQATITNSAGEMWSSAYDLLGRRIQATDPDSGTTTTTYDDLGQVVSSTDARSATTSTTYDALGRKTAVYDTTGGAAETTGDMVASWTYDTVPGAKGQLASATSYQNGNPYTQTITGYDGGYRATSWQISIPKVVEGLLGGVYDFGASYHVDGTLATESFPAAGGLPAETVTHTYDNLGEPASTYGTIGSDYVEQTLWTPDMKPATYSLGLGQNALWSGIDFAYDPSTARLSEVTVQRQTDNWANDADFRYGYDQAGDVTSLSETVAGDYQCFTYDYLRRLTAAWAQGSAGCPASVTASGIGGPSAYLEQFTYDSTGNRTSESISYSSTNYVDYPQNTFPAAGSAQPHTLTSQQVVSSAYGFWNDTRAYDPAGNTTSIVTPSTNAVLSWNHQGELASVVDSVSSHATTFVYDAAGILLVRHDDSAAMLYLPGEELALSGGTVTATRYYTHNGTTVAARTPAGVDWLVSDPHGTQTVMIDTSNQQVTQRRYDPFGNLRWPFPGSWPGDRSFVGGPLDSTTGLVDLGAREYDPVTGRFLSTDPLLDSSDPQQMNGFAYADNDPMTYSDPSGKMLDSPRGCTQSCGGPPQPDPTPNPSPAPPATPRYGYQIPSFYTLWMPPPPPVRPPPPPKPPKPPEPPRTCGFGGKAAFEMGCPVDRSRLPRDNTNLPPPDYYTFGGCLLVVCWGITKTRYGQDYGFVGFGLGLGASATAGFIHHSRKQPASSTTTNDFVGRASVTVTGGAGVVEGVTDGRPSVYHLPSRDDFAVEAGLGVGWYLSGAWTWSWASKADDPVNPDIYSVPLGPGMI